MSNEKKEIGCVIVKISTSKNAQLFSCMIFVGWETSKCFRGVPGKDFSRQDSDNNFKKFYKITKLPIYLQGEHQGCGSWIWLKLQEVLLHHK